MRATVDGLSDEPPAVAGGKTSAADSLAHTGIDMSLVTVLAMAMLAAGITLERLRRMTR